MQVHEVMMGLFGSAMFGLVGWFCNRVLNKMDELHDDIKELTITHGDRLARLETKVCRQ
jgi:hypothetical protein